jgi:CIC family chloride channel protein
MTTARAVVLRLLDLTRAWERHGILVGAALIGVLGALATVGFRRGIEMTQLLLYGRADGLVRIAADLPYFWRVVTPGLGGLAAGAILAWARHSTSQVRSSEYMEAIVIGDGNLGVRSSLLRALSSAITVASGGAIGREGSMVQLAALTGSLVGRWSDAPMPRKRLLVACGAAAGVATAYDAPIAGALFVAEIVLHSVAIESLGPLLVASVTADLTFTQLFGLAPVYQMPALTAPDSRVTAVLALLGLLSGLGAVAYRWVLDAGRAIFNRLELPIWAAMGLGGLVVGALSVWWPEVWGNGYSVVNSILQGSWLWPALIAVLFPKLVAVASTTGSGAVGGVFTPTLFMGAVFGAFFGGIVGEHWPGFAPQSLCAAVGMGAFLAACTHAPLMSILMLVEMTASYALMVPLMLACVLAYWISVVLRSDSIYSDTTGKALPAPSVTIARQLMREDTEAVMETASRAEVEQCFLKLRRPHVYVTDVYGHFIGAVSVHDFMPGEEKPPQHSRKWQASIRREFPTVLDVAPVWQVMEAFSHHPGERLPVIDEDRRLRGYVTKTDLMLMFRERLNSAE